MLVSHTIDLEELKSNKINESYVAQFAADIKYLLWHLNAPSTYEKSFSIKGSQRDLDRFSDVIAGEKNYMDAFIKYGLGDPRVRNNKMRLEKAIYSFEKDTGLKWPLT